MTGNWVRVGGVLFQPPQQRFGRAVYTVVYTTNFIPSWDCFHYLQMGNLVPQDTDIIWEQYLLAYVAQ